MGKWAEYVAGYPTVREAAAARGVTERVLYQSMADERKREGATPIAEAAPGLVFPKLPSANMPIEAVIRRLAKEERLRDKRAKAEKWCRTYVQDPLPIGVLWFGDPHLGTNTHWDKLESDIAACVTTPGLYGANMGDAADNWVGSLMRLAAEVDIGRPTERRLARWFLAEAGVPWLLWIMGNHDEWNDGSEFIKSMNIHNRVPMFDWDARIKLVWPNGKEIKIHAAHDFPGHSMWNPTHGPARAPRMNGSGAHLYIGAHKHTWGVQQFELPETGMCPLALRVRGYKRNDSHARRLGFAEDANCQSILTIFDPNAGPAGKVLAFGDIEQGVKVLRALRGETASNGKAKTPRAKTKADGNRPRPARKGRGLRNPRRKVRA